MTTKTLTMTDTQAAKLTVASAAYMLSSGQFMLAAVDAALATCAENDERIARMFERIECNERKPELVPA